jgi:DNA-directed RNA polymerase subunit F
MVKPQLIGQEPVMLAEVKESLANIKERDGELSFRAGKCEDYLNDFVDLSAKKANGLKKKIEDLSISRLKTEHVITIVDLLPETVDELKVVLGTTVSISKKDAETVVSLVKER